MADGSSQVNTTKEEDLTSPATEEGGALGTKNSQYGNHYYFHFELQTYCLAQS